MTVLAAVPTLFGTDGSVDLAANRKLYGHVSGLLDGLLVAGTTGEFPALSDDERLALVAAALETAGPSRVIAHVGAPSAFQAARLARAAAELGATRLAAITPYYLPVRPDDLAPYFAAVRAAAPSATLYAYIFPERTGVHVPAQLFATVASTRRPGLPPSSAVPRRAWWRSTWPPRPGSSSTAVMTPRPRGPWRPGRPG